MKSFLLGLSSLPSWQFGIPFPSRSFEIQNPELHLHWFSSKHSRQLSFWKFGNVQIVLFSLHLTCLTPPQDLHPVSGKRLQPLVSSLPSSQFLYPSQTSCLTMQRPSKHRQLRPWGQSAWSSNSVSSSSGKSFEMSLKHSDSSRTHLLLWGHWTCFLAFQDLHPVSGNFRFYIAIN